MEYGQQRGSGLSVEQAVFLVGGLGTRLQDLTRQTAKPMLPVGGRPFLDYLLEEAARHGVKRALLLCGYKADDLGQAYAGRMVRGMRVETAVEPSPAGTAGARWMQGSTRLPGQAIEMRQRLPTPNA